MELNPNHPVTQAMHDQWHKIAALLLHKLGLTHVVITGDDLPGIEGLFVVVQELPDGLHVSLTDAQTARRLAREHGGLPS